VFRFKVVGLAALVTVALIVSVGPVPASTPPTSAVTVPASAGQTVRDNPPWTGTVSPGTNPTSDCSPPSASPVDEHEVSVTVPSNDYDLIDANFKFTITWTPNSPDRPRAT